MNVPMRHTLFALASCLSTLVLAACGSDGGGPSGPASSTNPTSGGSTSSSSGGSSGSSAGSTPGESSSSSSAPTVACAGKVVASVEACAAPCVYTELLDDTNGPGPNGGQVWCSAACTSDADCKAPGEICDVKGPTTPRSCVKACANVSDCTAVGLPQCAPLNDGRKACF